MIRLANLSDLNLMQNLHNKFYKEEFELPKELYHIVNSDDIVIGGVRPIVECVAVTDLNASVRDRRNALINFLQAVASGTRSRGFKELHAFVQGEAWKKHLEKFDFVPTKGEALVLHL